MWPLPALRFSSSSHMFHCWKRSTKQMPQNEDGSMIGVLRVTITCKPAHRDIAHEFPSANPTGPPLFLRSTRHTHNLGSTRYVVRISCLNIATYLHRCRGTCRHNLGGLRCLSAVVQHCTADQYVDARVSVSISRRIAVPPERHRIHAGCWGTFTGPPRG